jgi:glycosyltransferase involved in cell wall biosynthesis
MVDLEPIDVVMCTWNSNKFYFRKCLLSIKKEVDVHHFIVIDRNSSDGTLEVVRSVFPNAEIFQTDANLACARRIGITHVDTRYFALIESDIEVYEGWFRKAISLIKSDRQIGAVQGFTRYYPSYMDKPRAFELGRRKEPVREITERGFAHDIVLTTELVRDFNPPPAVHSWGDYLMTQHIIRKGCKWLETSEAQAMHYVFVNGDYFSDLRKNILKGKWNGAGDRLVNPHSSSTSRAIVRLVLGLFTTTLAFLRVSIAVLDPRISLLNFLGYTGYLNGFLSPNENNVPYKLHTPTPVIH